MLASYCVGSEIRKDFNSVTDTRSRVTLLAVSPLSGVCNGQQTNDTCMDKATYFDADAHINFFADTLDVYNLEFEKWCVRLIGDNATVNLKIARLS